MTAIWQAAVLILIGTGNVAGDRLDEVLLKDLMPTIGSKCKVSSGDYTGQSSSFTFEHSTSPSYWDASSVNIEPNVFLAELSNENSLNANKSWTMRLSTAGNIYSFRGAYGEAMPPQFHPNGEFVDEVIQSVAVGLELNNGPRPYFMHQSGIYTKDGNLTPEPWFSPSIAKFCEDKGCYFGTWGQQAHTPTPHTSNTLYFNGYRDCGDGIIEFTTVVHNSDLAPFEKTNYHNTPWGGTRTSTLRDIYLSSVAGDIYQRYPIIPWSADPGTIIDASATGGFTTFTEQVVAPDDLFDEQEFDYPEQNGVPLTLSAKGNNAASYQGSRSDRWNSYCMKVSVTASFVAPTGCIFQCLAWVENGSSGERFLSNVIVHYAHQGNSFFVCTRDEGFTSNTFNSMFSNGDEIKIYNANVGKSFEDNLALQIVHGQQKWLGSWRPSSRIRFGRGGTTQRDYTVYTTNTRQTINPGETYVFTQMLATGRLAEMEDIGNDWVSEVYEELFETTEMTDGTDIHLYSTDALEFGPYIDGDDACNIGVSRCVGSSLPILGKVAHFSIVCGNETYVGSDKYHFSPERDADDNIRSYICDVEGDFQPSWKLLGYFEEGTCDFLSEAKYAEEFCDRQTADDPWELGPPEFSQMDSEYFKIIHEVQGLPDIISADILDFDCKHVVPQPEVVSIFSSEYKTSLNEFVMELYFNTTMITSSSLVTFVAGDFIGEAAGLIKFCTRLFAIDAEDNLPLVHRSSKYILEFNMTKTEFQTFLVGDIDIEEVDAQEASQDIDQLPLPTSCECDTSGACIATGTTYAQESTITICVTAPSPSVFISNMVLNMTGSQGFLYQPVQIGETTFATDAITTVELVNNNLTAMVTTLIVAQFFLLGADPISISGDVFYQFSEDALVERMEEDENQSGPFGLIVLLEQEAEHGCLDSLLKALMQFFR